MDQDKTKMEAMLRSLLDEILESKLTPILSSILDAELKSYEESMTFFNTSFESMKVRMDSLEKQTKTLAQENDRLRSESAKMNKKISDLRSSIDEQAQYTRRECLEIRGVPVSAGEDTNEIVKTSTLRPRWMTRWPSVWILSNLSGFTECCRGCSLSKSPTEVMRIAGVIYLRRNEHTPAIRITSVGDLERLQPRRPTSESSSLTSTEVPA